MAILRRIGMEPWRYTPTSHREAAQATYDRLSRRYKGLDPAMIRAAWHRHMDEDPTEQIVEGIRTGKKLRFK